jgi:hypothetical protein
VATPSQWILPSGDVPLDITTTEDGDLWRWRLEHPNGRSRTIDVFIDEGITSEQSDPIISAAAESQGRTLIDDLLTAGTEEHVQRIVVTPDGVALEN